jgi:hypothetical protein
MKNILCLLFIFLSYSVIAQKADKKTSKEELTKGDFTATEIEVDSVEKDVFSQDVVFKEIKKKKPKKNFYFGQRTHKGFTKVGGAGNQVIELFNYLRTYKDPDPYLQDVYWYSTKEKRIKRTTNIDKGHALILHGPYVKIQNEDTVEEGNYYMGAKHGRWTTYKKGFILTDKKVYHKGWPKESEITYYDNNQKKIKEVIPKQFGIVHGDYYSFYDNGMLMEEGEYKYGAKVGKWVEYHKLKRKRKKETQYPKDPYDKNFEPYTLMEYDERGNVTYDYEKEKKSLSTKKTN